MLMWKIMERSTKSQRFRLYIYINESWDRKLLVPCSFVDGKYEGQHNFNVIGDISKCYVVNL